MIAISIGTVRLFINDRAITASSGQTVMEAVKDAEHSFHALPSPVAGAGWAVPLVLVEIAYGLAGVDLETYTGEGPISDWSSYVALIQMGGHGSFADPGPGIDLEHKPELVTRKLPALLEYRLNDPAATKRPQLS